MVPPVGPLEPARAGAVGTGERAALVAEQLALDQALGQGRAVHADERARRAGGVPMQGRGDELLAGAALADDQDRLDRGGGAAHRLEHLPHRGASSHERRLVVAVVVGRRLARLDRQRLLAERPRHGPSHLVQVEWLGEVVVGPAAHGLDRRPRRPERGDHDHGQIGEPLAQLGQDFQAIAVGHLHVKEHGVGPVLGDGRERRQAVADLDDAVSFGAEEPAEVAADGRVVVGHEHGGILRRQFHHEPSEGRVTTNSAPPVLRFPGRDRPRRGRARSRGRWPGPARSRAAWWCGTARRGGRAPRPRAPARRPGP